MTRAVVNEEARGEAALLAAENARLRGELAMFRALQQARASWATVQSCSLEQRSVFVKSTSTIIASRHMSRHN